MPELSASNLVTIIGGSGFIGRNLVRELAKTGARLRVAIRHPNEAMFLKTMGDVGQVQIAQANIRDDASLANALAGASHVVSLVGTFSKGSYDALHVGGAERVARLCVEAGVERLVHMSAIGANKKSDSAYGRSKAAGEEAAREHFADVTIIRPSVVFGPEDGFFCRFAGLAKALPFLPLPGGGNCLFQPVYVDDVADAIVAILGDDTTAGQVYELGGPRIMSLKETYEYVLETTHRSRLMPSIPFWAASFAAIFLQMLPGNILRPDQVQMMKSDNVVAENALTIEDLGIAPVPAEAVMPAHMRRFRKAGAYEQD